MILQDLLFLTLIYLVTTVTSIAHGDTDPSSALIPTSIQADQHGTDAFVPSSTAILESATAAAATVGSNRPALPPAPPPLSSTIALAAVVPIAAVSASVAAILFQMYRNRWEKLEQEAEKHSPAELEAAKIPFELEAREPGRGRYSPVV
jgi:hypothetical protein